MENIYQFINCLDVTCYHEENCTADNFYQEKLINNIWFEQKEIVILMISWLIWFFPNIFFKTHSGVNPLCSGRLKEKIVSMTAQWSRSKKVYATPISWVQGLSRFNNFTISQEMVWYNEKIFINLSIVLMSHHAIMKNIAQLTIFIK